MADDESVLVDVCDPDPSVEVVLDPVFESPLTLVVSVAVVVVEQPFCSCSLAVTAPDVKEHTVVGGVVTIGVGGTVTTGAKVVGGATVVTGA